MPHIVDHRALFSWKKDYSLEVPLVSPLVAEQPTGEGMGGMGETKLAGPRPGLESKFCDCSLLNPH